MRTAVIAVFLWFPSSLFAQTSPCAPVTSSVLAFDPYKPSHAAIVRNYGAALLAQAPLSTLLALDPYVPSEAALLRQLGGAIPLWSYPAYPGLPLYPMSLPVPHARQGEPCEPVRDAAEDAAAITTFNEVLALLEERRVNATVTTGSASPGRNSGVSIQHAGRVWVSAGPAVPFSKADFVRADGGGANSVVYRRASGRDPAIYVPTTAGMVAPFRPVAESNRK